MKKKKKTETDSIWLPKPGIQDQIVFDIPSSNALRLYLKAKPNKEDLIDFDKYTKVENK